MAAGARDLEQPRQVGALLRPHELRLRRAAPTHGDDHRLEAALAQQRPRSGPRPPSCRSACRSRSPTAPGRRSRAPLRGGGAQREAGGAVLETVVKRHRGQLEALRPRPAPDRRRGRRTASAPAAGRQLAEAGDRVGRRDRHLTPVVGSRVVEHRARHLLLAAHEQHRDQLVLGRHPLERARATPGWCSPSMSAMTLTTTVAARGGRRRRRH